MDRPSLGQTKYWAGYVLGRPTFEKRVVGGNLGWVGMFWFCFISAPICGKRIGYSARLRTLLTCTPETLNPNKLQRNLAAVMDIALGALYLRGYMAMGQISGVVLEVRIWRSELYIRADIGLLVRYRAWAGNFGYGARSFISVRI